MQDHAPEFIQDSNTARKSFNGHRPTRRPSPKLRVKSPQAAQNCIFANFRPTFCRSQNLQKIMIFKSLHLAKTSLLQLQASHFGIKHQSTNHVVSSPFLGPHFFFVFFDLFSKWSLWNPLQNPVGANMAPQIDLVAPKGFKFIVRRFPFCVLSFTLRPRRRL